MRSIRAGVLGHWGGNIGHDIMALGVECILQEAFAGQVECARLEQHRPMAVYPPWHPLRHLPFLRHGRGGMRVRALKRWINRRDVSEFLWRSSWVDSLDLGIACGGPLITPHMAQGDLELMYQHMHGAFMSKKVPLLNLSLGSAYPLEAIPTAVTGAENRQFLQRVLEYARVTTVRDALAQRLCASVGTSCEIVRDTGFAAGSAFAKMASGTGEQRYIVISYQKYGANEDWGQKIDSTAWQNTLKSLIERLRQRYNMVFVCHSAAEVKLAQELDAALPCYQPKTMQEYAQVVGGAMAGLCNRIHAAVPLASVGVPAIGVGTDSRLGNLQMLGLPCFYVKDVNAELLEETLEGLINNLASERERLFVLRDKTMKRYIEIVRHAVSL